MDEKIGYNILVVDDDPLNVRLLETFLSKQYTVYGAYSGEEALDILGSRAIDLVMLDIMMPGMDGYEVCRRIKADESTNFIPVIIITALSSKDDRIRGIDAGADEFLVKPIDRVEVLTRVRTLLKNKHLYDELKCEKDRVQTYLDIAGCIIVALENDGTVKIANKKCCQLLDYNEHELIGRNWMDLVIPDDEKDDVFQVFESICNGNLEDSRINENCILTKNKEKRIIRWNNSYIRDSEGNIKTIISSGSDVTEERLATMKLQASESKFRILFENAADAILIFDFDCNVIDANSVASDLLDYSMDELLGLSRDDLVAPEFHGVCNERVADIMENKSNRFEITYMKKDGSYVPVEMGVRVIEYDGKPALLSNVRDISERKLAEKELRESEHKFRLLAENANDVIWTMTKDGKFTYNSPSVFKLRGYTPEEASNQTFEEIFPPEHIETLKNAMKSFHNKLEEGEGNYSETFEIEQYHKDGSRIWTESIANPVFDEDGNFQFFLGVTRDISERKKAEEEIKRYTEELAMMNEELESLDRMKDEFISNLSHELKTPLISIKGYSELVYDEVLGPLNSKQKGAMKTVLDKYDHLSFLMDSLIYMSIVKSGKVKYRLDPIRIEDTLTKVVDYFSFKSEEKDLIIVFDFQEQLPLMKGDVEYLPYLFRSIIDNAVKFSSNGSEILIRAFENKGNIHVTVTDYGIGIPEHEIDNIFQRFYQIDSSKSRKYGGSGMGLYVCKTIADIHNGEIWVESNEGSGTTVHVTFPAFCRSK
ncbi:PAS domain S-box protein [Methanolobus bombayensis]|uniref:PAS domain S-box protein n=1 Tax=Methanolobus bombayensis TaxID=38023 RepID=UPI001AE3E50C|nr:PAS domain S-box protein [Methanolobus bombayensis]MBP1910340.1 PAS domain S-box-containing protein [Methanolobus bombayensis]